MYQDASRTYQEANYLTATPMKLMVMCYDNAIGSLKLARDAYIAKDYETKGEALQKTIDIINELNASLDMQRGGEIAANLRSLYLYIVQALIEADLKRDLCVFDASVNTLEELASAWKTITAPTVHNGHERHSPPIAIADSAKRVTTA
jgi:flagellar secretion chaperone FliS